MKIMEPVLKSFYGFESLSNLCVDGQSIDDG